MARATDFCRHGIMEGACDSCTANKPSRKPLNDTELNALTAIVMFERAEWEYGVNRYNEAQFDPSTRSCKALYAELEHRGIIKP